MSAIEEVEQAVGKLEDRDLEEYGQYWLSVETVRKDLEELYGKPISIRVAMAELRLLDKAMEDTRPGRPAREVLAELGKKLGLSA